MNDFTQFDVHVGLATERDGTIAVLDAASHGSTALRGALWRRFLGRYLALSSLLAVLCLPNQVAAQPEPGARVFDPSRVAVVKFTMTPGDLARMRRFTFPPGGGLEYPYVPANLEFDGQVITNIAVRHKGNSSMGGGQHPSLKIDFNDFQPGARLDGLKKLNLHNALSETSNLAEFLSYEAWREMGVPASRTGWTEVWVNGQNWGLYTSVEEIDQAFIDRHFKYREGDLYKPELPAGSLLWQGTNITNYARLNWQLQADTDHAAFLRLVDVVNNQSAAAFSQVLDLKGVLTYLAGNVALGNWDDYTMFAHNYYLYENEPGRFTFLPWDMNLSQGQNVNLRPFLGNSHPVSDKLLQDPLHVQIYLRILRSFLETAASKSSLNRRLDYAANVLGSRLATNAVSTLRSNISARVDRLRTSLFASLTNSPIPRLHINEIMADNTRTRADEAGEFDDWIELYNPGEHPLDLGGMYLTDDPRDSRKWRFPTNTMIAAKGHLLVWADEHASQGPLHVNFKFDKAGEFIGLYDVEERANHLIDSIMFGPQLADISQGRMPDGDEWWVRQSRPTPGTSNDTTDTDRDGLPDAWEMHFGLNPGSAADAEGDPDGDGLTNLREYASHTDPKTPDPALRILETTITSNNRIRLSWLAEPGRMAQVQATTNLTNSAWRNVGLPVPDGVYSELLPNWILVPQQFYRLVPSK
jgi:hypothetical protein